MAHDSPERRLVGEARGGLRSGQLAERLVQHFGLRGGQRVAGGVAEQDGGLQGEEEVSVLLGVLRCGGGIACRLLEEEEIVRR